MTMPHMMNCSHCDDGWCLDCVKVACDEIDQLRADRDRLAESLFALRGRLTVSARDERLPEPVRHLLVCLLHGHGIERATVALAATSAADSIRA